MVRTVDRLYSTLTVPPAEVQSEYPVDLHTLRMSDPFRSDRDLLAIAIVIDHWHCLDFEFF